MNVTILFKSKLSGNDAIQWLKNTYAEYPDGSIVSSFISQDNIYTTAYVVVDQDKLSPSKKKLIKIT